jgi:hypothetical protein
MKKLFLIIVLVLVPFIVFGAGAREERPSAQYTADQDAVTAGVGYFTGIVVITDGTNDCTIKVYDALTVAGAVAADRLIPDWVVTTSSTQKSAALGSELGIPYYTGISVDITVAAGTCTYMVYFDPR